MNIIICIAGMTGSGKSVLSDYFSKRGYKFFRFGQAILDEVKKRGLEPIEKNERSIREELRKKHGMAAIAVLNYPKFVKQLKETPIIADGLYSWSEYKYLKERLGDQMIVVAIYAPPKTRYERLAKRKLKKSDTNMKYRPATEKAAKARDYAEIENLEKGGPIVMADHTIVNTENLSSYNKQIHQFFKEIHNK